jgi:hypothetical protein
VLFDKVSAKGRRSGIVPNGSACTGAAIERSAAPAANSARFIALILA